MIKTVLFDVGGVLVEGGSKDYTKQKIADYFGKSLDELNISDLHQSFSTGQISSDEFFAELNSRHANGKKLTEQKYVGMTADIFIPRPGVLGLAKWLKSKGVQTGILSNTNEVQAEEIKKAGVYDPHNPVLLSYQVGFRKPDKDIYSLAIEKSGSEPSEVMFIDDQPANLNPARELGIDTVHFHSENQTVKAVMARVAIKNGL